MFDSSVWKITSMTNESRKLFISTGDKTNFRSSISRMWPEGMLTDNIIDPAAAFNKNVFFVNYITIDTHLTENVHL